QALRDQDVAELVRQPAQLPERPRADGAVLVLDDQRRGARPPIRVAADGRRADVEAGRDPPAELRAQIVVGSRGGQAGTTGRSTWEGWAASCSTVCCARRR